MQKIQLEITRDQAEAIMALRALLRQIPDSILYRVLPISEKDFDEIVNLSVILSIKTYDMEDANV